MVKKGSLSLSINAIVVLILAITMLGLALTFIRTMFGKTAGQVEALAGNEPEPQPAGPSNPITLSRSTIVVSPSDTTSIKFSVYNGAAAYTPANILLQSIECLDGDPFTLVSQINKEVLVGQTVQSQVVLKASNSGGVDTVCSICSVGGLSQSTIGKCADVRVTIR